MIYRSIEVLQASVFFSFIICVFHFALAGCESTFACRYTTPVLYSRINCEKELAKQPGCCLMAKGTVFQKKWNACPHDAFQQQQKRQVGGGGGRAHQGNAGTSQD